MTGPLAGVPALVTGGTSGIGEAVVRLLAAEGAQVVFCGRREEPGRALEAELGEQGARVRFIPCDVSSEAEVESLVDRTVDWAGGLTLAVNSAGISPKRAPLVDSTVEAYESVFAVNVRGTFLSLKYEMRAMGSGGVITNVASVLGTRAFNLGHALYTASKHAVIGLTKTAALEGAPRGIRVNAVCPGGIDTPIHASNLTTRDSYDQLVNLHPWGRLGTPGEVASAIVYLGSPGASFLTGVALAVDGGATL